MKQIIILIILLPFFLHLNAGDISFTGLRERIYRNPASTLLVLDSLESQASLPLYKIELLRALAYRTQSRFYLGMHHAHLALTDKEMQKDTVLMPHAYMVLSENAILSYQLGEAAKVIADGKKYADTHDKLLLKAHMLQMESSLYRRMGTLIKGYESISEAITLLSKKDVPGDSLLLSNCLGYLMAYYIEDKRLEKAWQTGLKREKVIADLVRESKADAYILDKHKGYFYSKMAFLARKMGYPQRAKGYADLFYTTDFSCTQAGTLEINDYLLETGNFEAVLKHNNRYLSQIDSGDSLNIIYLRTLIQSGQAYSALKDYGQAYQAVMLAYDIRKKMRMSVERNQMLDLADVTEAVVHEYELKNASYKVKMQQWIIASLAGFVLLLLVLLAFLYHTYGIIRQKNKKMSALILELDDKRKTITCAKAETCRHTMGALHCDMQTHCPYPHREFHAAVVSEEEELFLQFDRLVKEKNCIWTISWCGMIMPS